MQGEEITALKKFANSPLNDESICKIAKKRTKKGTENKTYYCRVFQSTDSSSKNEKPRRKNRKKKTKKQVESSESSESENEDEETDEVRN